MVDGICWKVEMLLGVRRSVFVTSVEVGMERVGDLRCGSFVDWGEVAILLRLGPGDMKFWLSPVLVDKQIESIYRMHV